jgi:hypothetical protein
MPLGHNWLLQGLRNSYLSISRSILSHRVVKLGNRTSILAVKKQVGQVRELAHAHRASVW